MSNVVSGRQLRTARVFAGLTQAQFANALGIDERTLQSWESNDDALPTLRTVARETIEDVLLQNGVTLSPLATRRSQRSA